MPKERVELRFDDDDPVLKALDRELEGRGKHLKRHTLVHEIVEQWMRVKEGEWRLLLPLLPPEIVARMLGVSDTNVLPPQNSGESLREELLSQEQQTAREAALAWLPLNDDEEDALP